MAAATCGFHSSLYHGFDCGTVQVGLRMQLMCTKSHSAWVSLQEKQRLEATQGCNASPSEQYLINAQANQRLLSNFTSNEQKTTISNLPMLTGSRSMASHVSGELSKLFSPSSHQEELLTSTLGAINVANTSGQKVGPSVQNTSKAEKAAFNEDSDPVIENLLNSFWMFEEDHKELLDKSTLGESSRKMKNLLGFEEGNTGMHEFAGFTPPALQDDDNKSETSDCSSQFRILPTAADASIVQESESNKEG